MKLRQLIEKQLTKQYKANRQSIIDFIKPLQVERNTKRTCAKNIARLNHLTYFPENSDHADEF